MVFIFVVKPKTADVMRISDWSSDVCSSDLDYQSLYLNLHAQFRSVSDAEKEAINDDVVFEIELIKQVEINVDYILMLVERFIQAKGTGDDKEIRATIDRAINSSPSLRNKKDLIEQFVDSVSASAKVDAQWQAFMAAKKAEELEQIGRAHV